METLNEFYQALKNEILEKNQIWHTSMIQNA